MNKLDGYLKQFNIQFSGLKVGQHDYKFELGNLFFEHFNIEDVTDGQVNVDFTLFKRETMLELRFEFKGTVQSTCDRCLEPLEMEVEGENEILVKFGEERNYEDDELIIIPHEEYRIDVAPFIYEIITVLLPLRKVHKEDQCNEEVLKRLQKQDDEGLKDENEIPSVWDKLKKLK